MKQDEIKPNVDLRNRSGNIQVEGKLVSFLYELMRDHVPPGKVEKLVRITEAEEAGTNLYSNGWLASYANDLANRLKEGK